MSSDMQHLYTLAANALLALAGVLMIVFRRQFAEMVIRRNRFLYDNVPTLFPSPAAKRERYRRVAHEVLAGVVGIGFIAGGLYQLWSLR